MQKNKIPHSVFFASRLSVTFRSSFLLRIISRIRLARVYFYFLSSIIVRDPDSKKETKTQENGRVRSW